MSVLQHPDYPTLFIVVGGKAVAGKFYVTYSGHYLSHIANDAYGSGGITAIKRINKSKYNQQHCIYRKSSSNCNAAIVPGNMAELQNSWTPDIAWISLCPKDKAGTDGLGSLLGVTYQVIWVPTADGKEPWDLYQPEPSPGPEPIPGPKPFPPPEPEPIPPGPGPIPPPGPKPPVKKAAFPWWLGALLGGGALITVIVFAVRDKKKGKKRRGKK